MEPRKKSPAPKTGRAKKGSAKSGTAKNPRLSALAKELYSLVPSLDEEGLSFLVEQAQVHLYNMQVDKHNQAVIRNAEESSRSSKSEKAKKPGQADRDIQISSDKNSHYMVYQGKWVMFTPEEMLQLAKIAAAPVDKDERNSALFRWFERERPDFF